MNAPRPAESGQASRLLIYSGFVLTGVVTVQLGPLLPLLSAKWRLNDAQTGYLFTTQFLASMLGVSLTSWLLPRFGFRAPLALAYALMALGAAALNSGPWSLGLAAMFCCGVGIGVGVPASNLWTGAITPDRRAAALSLLNAAWGLGAVLCAPMLALALRASGSALFLYVLAALLALNSLAFVFVSPGAARSRPDVDAKISSAATTRVRTFLALGLLFFLYVGSENSIGGWVAVYARRIGAGEIFSTLAPSFFWVVLLVGRLACPALLKRVGEAQIAMGGLILASLGTILLVAAHKLSGVVAGTCLAGFGLAAIYPITIAHLSRLGPQATRVSGLMFALAGLGGAILPEVVGALSFHYSNLKIGLMVPACGTLAMMALYAGERAWRSTTD